MVLLTIVAALTAVATALFIAMFRRDEAMLGLAGLTVVLAAAFAAVVYGGVDSL